MAVFHLAVIHALKNYKALIGLSIFLITCLVIFAHLWKIAAAKMGAVDLRPDQLLWYIAFNQWILISLPDIHTDMEEDLRSGRLAYLLPRPISYLGTIFAEAAGTLCVNLTLLGIVAFAFTYLRIGSIPFHFVEFTLAIGLGLLAGCLGILFLMIVGLTAFWVQEVSPFYWFWEKLLFLLGGLLLPLAVYPEWLQTVAHFTPFPAILGERSALVFGCSLSNFLYVIGTLLCWGAIGLIGLTLVYRRGLRILNIGGG